MCGRFALDTKTHEEIVEFVELGGDPADWWTAAYNIKPTQDVPVLFESAKGDEEPQRRYELGRWSLVPPWSKELKLKFPTFNARSEDITSKATWKSPVKSKRAVVPMTGYYEWKTHQDGSKTPHFITSPDGEPLLMAGLYGWWRDPAAKGDDDGWVLTATILTSAAVDNMVGIHDRNPVPLPRDFVDSWLSPEIVGDQALVDAAVAAALPIAQELRVYEVAPLRGDGPELVRPVH